ncbi:MAG: hypothetical protein WC570_03410 [Patescibacteria group bacterium]
MIENKEIIADKSLEKIGNNPLKILVVGDKKEQINRLVDILKDLAEYSPEECGQPMIDGISPLEIESLLISQCQNGKQPDYIIWKGISDHACENIDGRTAAKIFERTMLRIKLKGLKIVVIPYVSCSRDHKAMVANGAVDLEFKTPFALGKHLWPELKRKFKY